MPKMKAALKMLFLTPPGRGRNTEITDEEKLGSSDITCQKLAAFGCAAETWTYAKLTSHINKTAEGSGYLRLSTIHKSTVNTILDEANIKPLRIKYYQQNRDPQFDEKMHNVLFVYKPLSFQFEDEGNFIPWEEDEEVIHVLSYDVKSDIQAIATVSVDEDLSIRKTLPCLFHTFQIWWVRIPLNMFLQNIYRSLYPFFYRVSHHPAKSFQF